MALFTIWSHVVSTAREGIVSLIVPDGGTTNEADQPVNLVPYRVSVPDAPAHPEIRTSGVPPPVMFCGNVIQYDKPLLEHGAPRLGSHGVLEPPPVGCAIVRISSPPLGQRPSLTFPDCALNCTVSTALPSAPKSPISPP